MEIKLREIGNSKGIIINSNFLLLMGIDKDSEKIEMKFDGKRIILEKAENKKECKV